MIRRRKKDVLLQLPERMDKVLFVTMTEPQSAIHEEYKYHVAKLIMKWRRQGFLNEKDRQNLMIFLNIMRMVCDSTFIIDQETRNDSIIGELMDILGKVFAEGDEKVVIFSQWERMTRIVSGELDDRNIKYQYLHGGCPVLTAENYLKISTTTRGAGSFYQLMQEVWDLTFRLPRFLSIWIYHGIRLC